MPTEDKKRGTWIGRVQKAGYPPRKKRGFKTKAAAITWEVEEARRILNPDPIRLTFSQCSTKYLLWCKRRREHSTYRYKENIVKSFLKFLGQDLVVEDITNQTIENYLDTTFDPSSGKTANRYLRELKTLFNWLMQRNIIQTNPCRPVETYKEDLFIKYVPSLEDFYKVLAVAEDWEKDFILCTFYTAARRVEIIRLKWNDIDFKTNEITLWTKKRKGGVLEPDQLHINQSLKKILKKRWTIGSQAPDCPYVFFRPPGKPLSKNTIDNLMPRLCKKADVTPFGLHAIRHLAATIMAASKELSLVDVQKMLRQKRATTTDIYLHQLAKSKTVAADILGEALDDSKRND